MPNIVNIYSNISTLFTFLIWYLEIQFGVLKAIIPKPLKISDDFSFRGS